MTAPKCSSWRGHHFEPRYSEASADPDVVSLAVSFARTSSGAREIIEASAGSTYERDICMRCGYTIEKVSK